MTTDEVPGGTQILVDHGAYPSTLGREFPSPADIVNGVICHGIEDSTVIEDATSST